MDRRLLLLTMAQFFFRIVREESTDVELEHYFILNDSTLKKTGFCWEGICWMFDYIKLKSVLSYKLLMLALTEKKSTVISRFTSRLARRMPVSQST